MVSLKDKIVFITGATSGIGKSCAVTFAKGGANLIISSRRGEMIARVAESIRKEFGAKVYSFELDVRDRRKVLKTVEALPAEFRKIDILINNAGLARGLNKFYEDDPDNWEEMIDTNV